jgi:exonuclease III
MRIDYVFVTEPLAARCDEVRIDVNERRKPKPSDHTPVIGVFR